MIGTALHCVHIYLVHHAHALHSIIVVTVFGKVFFKYVENVHPNIVVHVWIVSAINALTIAISNANIIKILNAKIGNHNPSLNPNHSPSLNRSPNPSLSDK